MLPFWKVDLGNICLGATIYLKCSFFLELLLCVQHFKVMLLRKLDKFSLTSDWKLLASFEHSTIFDVLIQNYSVSKTLWETALVPVIKFCFSQSSWRFWGFNSGEGFLFRKNHAGIFLSDSKNAVYNQQLFSWGMLSQRKCLYIFEKSNWIDIHPIRLACWLAEISCFWYLLLLKLIPFL